MNINELDPGDFGLETYDQLTTFLQSVDNPTALIALTEAVYHAAYIGADMFSGDLSYLDSSEHCELRETALQLYNNLFK